jgi:hypothetical protein
VLATPRALLAACFLLVICFTYSSTLEMEAVRSSEASVNFYQITRRHVPEDSVLIWNFIGLRHGSISLSPTDRISSPVAASSLERRWRCHFMALLQERLIGDAPEATKYKEHTHEYNSAMAFASVKAEIKLPPGNGRYCFRMRG